MKEREILINEIVDKVVDQIKPIILNPKKYMFNPSHQVVYKELNEIMLECGADKEIPELEYKGVGILYDAISIEPNGLGDSIITLYRNSNDGDIVEAARLIL